MGATKFVHLHNHANTSLLDGLSRIEEMPKRAKELGQEAMAITDHGVMYGVISFYKACKAEGVNPIIGCEAYVTPCGRTRFEKDKVLDRESRHMVLLCENMTGYKNLCYMVSEAFVNGFYSKPRIDLDLLREYHEGLICLSACLAGEIPKQLLNGNYAAARDYAVLMSEVFGPDHFYLELQDHGIEGQAEVNAGILRIHDETGIPMVATNDCHYIHKEDAEAHDILLCVQTKKTIDDPDRLRYEPRNFYIRSTEEMEALFSCYDGAISNTQKIADMCNVEFEFGKYHLPQFDVPEGYTAQTYIRKLCEEGYAERYGERGNPELLKQLDYELNMIDRMGFTEYFLITSDFVQYAKKHDIPVGPGRGSAAGSMVSYCLSITDVEPTSYNLYFERFLNPERVSMPDIDMDFGDTKRDLVVDYVREKYGEDRVAQIITFGTMAAKGAIKDVARVLGIPFAESTKLAKMIPNEPHITIAAAMEMNHEMEEYYNSNEDAKRIIDLAKILEGTPRNASVHAAGVVITKDPVYTYVPLAKNGEDVVCQYDMVTLEELGLLKMDFLSLRNLSVIDDTIKMLRLENFDINSIPVDDRQVFEMLSAGDTCGVFQMESPGMTDVCVQLKPQSIEDLTAIVALYRPGPMDNIPQFVKCKWNPAEVKYKHPKLEPILSNTYGILVYQEQVIKTFQELAGYTLGQADMVRRAISKKKLKDINKEHNTFVHGDAERGIPGCINNGIPESVAESIYDDIYAFANYCFNKAHAVCYAVIAYQTAWLKYYHPKEYMAALLTSILDKPDKLSSYLSACADMSIEMKLPDVNHSDADFRVEDGCIRYGISAIKNLGENITKRLMENRATNGAFSSLGDLIERMSPLGINKKGIESLIKAGACDCFGKSRNQMMSAYPQILKSVQKGAEDAHPDQIDLYSLMGMDAKPAVADVYPNVGEYPKDVLLKMEKEVTGIYLSGHPMTEYRRDANAHHAVRICDILSDYEDTAAENHRYEDRDKIIVAGIVSGYERRCTNSGKQMAVFELSDETGTLNVTVFEKALRDCAIMLGEGEAVVIQGSINIRNETYVQVYCNKVVHLARMDNSVITPYAIDTELKGCLWLRLNQSNMTAEKDVIELVSQTKGNSDVRLYYEESKKKLGSTCRVGRQMLDRLERLLGPENVCFKENTGAC